ncbi:MAG: TatD family hydrolase, partial [Gaiellales bacterium]
RRVFAAQIELANDTGKPLVIHTRDADEETFPMLEEARVDVVLHCFSSPERVEDAAERGYYCSFAGNVTYPAAEALREAARRVPADRILAETDSPYLAPVPLRGKRNRPANVVHTLRLLAEQRGVEAAQLESQIEANAARVFRLPP